MNPVRVSALPSPPCPPVWREQKQDHDPEPDIETIDAEHPDRLDQAVGAPLLAERRQIGDEDRDHDDQRRQAFHAALAYFGISVLEGSLGSSSRAVCSAPVTGSAALSSSPSCTSIEAWSQ